MNDRSESRQRLIEEHHYLCQRGARKFWRKGLDRRDLEQVAAIGLIKAADRYDNANGTPFEAYAWAMVLGELMHYVRDGERVVRAPRRLHELDRRWLAAERDLWVRLGREPSTAEIGAVIGASPEEQREVSRYRRNTAMLSVESLRPFEHRALSYTLDHQLDRVDVQRALAELSALERQIIVEIYERDTPLMELAERLGYSRRHLSRLHRGALKKLTPYARPQIA